MKPFDRRVWVLFRMAQNRMLVNAAKNRPCTDCGETKPLRLMELDHVRGTKLFPLGRAGTRSEALVMAEIAKCEPRCIKCHRERHRVLMAGYRWIAISTQQKVVK